MRFGISVPNIGGPDELVELGVEAERHGWDGFFLWDHIRFSAEFAVPVVDPWVVLAVVAARTVRIRFGTLVTPLARRRPWKIARETVTLDRLSGGRVVLGVGLGFPADAEFASLGEDPDDRVRAEKLDEALEVLQALWSGVPVTFAGAYHRVSDVTFLPTPVQAPRIPVWVAGCWPRRGPFRRAARWDGVAPMGLDADGMARDVTAEELDEVVRYVRACRAGDAPFEVIAGADGSDPVTVAALDDAGATWYLPRPVTKGPGWEDEVLEIVRDGPPQMGSA